MKGKILNFGSEKHPCIVFNNINPDLQGREKEALYVVQIGWSNHRPRKTEILCRNSYTLHYVASGENYVNGEKMTAGQGYFMAPNENNIIKYPDTNTAEIFWIMFIGYKSESFLKECGIKNKNHSFRIDGNNKVINLIKQAIDADYSGEDIELSFLSLLYKIGAIHKNENRQNMTIKSTLTDIAVNYIEQNYGRIEHISEISDFVGLSQNHLCKIFKKTFSCSIKDYLTDIRIAAAKRLLESSEMNVTEIASAVGINDSMYFSQVFKKHTGLSPLKYRNKT